MSEGRATYRSAGVDLETALGVARDAHAHMRRTFIPGVLENPNGFAGLFALNGNNRLFRNYTDPVLVACTDGVGTKVSVAAAAGRYREVGIDLVAMSVNDLLVCGAEPIFFLDYVAAGRLERDVVSRLLDGVVEGCRQAECALLGGETAEMPGVYRRGEFDLAGFAVGVVERKKLLRGPTTIRPGDVVLGIASSGLHSNGFSLARKVLLEDAGRPLDQVAPELGRPLVDEMLEPTRIYARALREILAPYRIKQPIHALAHITGGGLVENIPRVLPPDCDVAIRRGSWKEPPIFRMIQKLGRVSREEMDRVFNLGIGMVVIVSPSFAGAALRRLQRIRENAFVIGQVVRGDGKVRFLGGSS